MVGRGSVRNCWRTTSPNINGIQDGLANRIPILSGAVHRGLQGNQVLNRKARCDYGIEFCRNFDEERDQGKTPVWCSWEEKWMIDNNMRWYIKKVRMDDYPLSSAYCLCLKPFKGDSFSEGQPVIFSFYRNIPKDSSFIFHETLYACVNGKAPLFKNDGKYISKYDFKS